MIFFEENQLLKNRVFVLPVNIVKHLNQTLYMFGKNCNYDGYKRLRHILDSGYNNKTEKNYNTPTITYSELKRIKNFFDNFVGDKKSIEYILNGGDVMKNWVNETLDIERESVKDLLNDKKNNKRIENNSLKTSKTPTKPVKLNGKDVYVTDVSEGKIIYISENQLKLIKK